MAVKDLFVNIGARHGFLELASPGQHAHQPAHAAHLLHLLQLATQILEVEGTLLELLRHFLGVFGRHMLGGLFDQRDDVTHAQDAVGDTAGVEIFQRIHLFADTDQLDRLAGGRAHRERRAATTVAIDASHNDAGDIQTSVETTRHIDRVLAGQRIDDKQDFMRIGDVLDGNGFFHQLFIDMRTARRIENEHIIAAQPTLALGAASDLDRGFACDDRQRVDADLFAQHAQLLHGRRTARIERGEQDLLFLPVLEPFGDLGRSGGLARALQAHHQKSDRRGGIEVDGNGIGPQDLHQLVIDDLDHLLARCHRAGDLGAHSAFADLLDKGAHHFKRNVGLDQRPADFTHGGVDIGSVQRAASTQTLENLAKPVA